MSMCIVKRKIIPTFWMVE
jgi:hypothetical protein